MTGDIYEKEKHKILATNQRQLVAQIDKFKNWQQVLRRIESMIRANLSKSDHVRESSLSLPRVPEECKDI